MGTQKPGEWANLVLQRFEDQVREFATPLAWRVGLPFRRLVSWPRRGSPSPSLLARSSLLATLFRCGRLLPLMSHPRCTVLRTDSPPSGFTLWEHETFPVSANVFSANLASSSPLPSLSLAHSPFSDYRISSFLAARVHVG